LRIVYFDQAREHLEQTETLRQGLGATGDTVLYNGRPIHVAGWAKRFLFDSGQLDRPIASLSGGEQARVLLARLMLEPADLLLMDEPTNDLDIPTLEVLEDSLTEFAGALMLVTHDRYLLDRVSTAILALDGEGGTEFFADCWQWEQAQADRRKAKLPAEKRESSSASRPSTIKKKLSYLEAREWEQMEARILQAEEKAGALRAGLQSAEVFSDVARLRRHHQELEAAEQEVADLYARWAELEAKQA
jgi:ATP-binding cassette subfamily F protein uup